MANQIQATVYQIDGSPLASPIQVAFLTNNIFIKATTTPLIPQVNAQITYYPNTSNQLQEQTFLVSESVATLVAAANVNGTTQISATVLEINQEPQVSGGVTFSFPVQNISIWPVSPVVNGVHSFIEFKNKKYYLLETEAALVAAANVGGGGGGSSTGINGLNGTTNIGLGGTLLNDTDIIIDNYEVNFKLNIDDNIATFSNSGIGFGVDIGGPNYTSLNFTPALFNTSFNGNDIGLKLDFSANQQYWLGNYNGDGCLNINLFNQVIQLNYIDGDIQLNSNKHISIGTFANLSFDNTQTLITTKYYNSEIGLKLDFASNDFSFGDWTGLYNGSYIDILDSGRLIRIIAGSNYNAPAIFIDDYNSLIETFYQGDRNGLKLDFNNGYFNFGDYLDNYSYGVNLILDSVRGSLKTNAGGKDIGLNLDFSYKFYALGSYISAGDGWGKGVIVNTSYSDLNPQVTIGDVHYDSPGNLTQLWVDDSSSIIKTSYQGNDIGLNFDFTNRFFQFGDWNNKMYLNFDLNRELVELSTTSEVQIITGNGSGFYAGGRITQIGDIEGNNNSNYFGIDDYVETLIATQNLLVTPAGPISGSPYYLKIRVNNVDYLISLEQQ